MSNRDTASTLTKGLAVLECFQSGRDDMTMADIARLTGFDRATARRLCLTLAQAGYLAQTGKTFSLTPQVVALAGGYMTAHDIGRVVQPVLNQFAEDLQGEIALAVRLSTRAVYVARSAVSQARSSMGFSVGSTLPLLHTSVGRMLIAMLPEPERSDLIATCPITRFNAATDLDRDSLGRKVAQAATQGFAYSKNEFELGAVGMAVPVISGTQTPMVLATTATVNHFAHEGQFDRSLDILRRAAMTLRP